MEIAIVVAIILIGLLLCVAGFALAVCFTWYLFGPSFFTNMSEKGFGFALSHASHRMTQIPEKLASFMRRNHSQDSSESGDDLHHD
jgi:hypothetical protein